ncbi:276_t:CDS:1, partial [Scutellospora calospora]
VPEIYVTNNFGSTNPAIFSLDTFNIFASDLSNYKLEDLQNLVVYMTSYTIPSKSYDLNNYTSF